MLIQIWYGGRPVISLVADLCYWLGLSSHSGVIAQLAHLYSKLEIPMKWSQQAQFGPIHMVSDQWLSVYSI